MGIPWRVAFALQTDGWWLRQDIIWAKPNPMPESVTDRCTKAHEYLFLLSKRERYYYDADAINEPATNSGKVISLGEKSFSKGQATAAGIDPSGNGTADSYTVVPDRNRRSVWTIPTQPYAEAHFATFPRALVEPCVMAGSRVGDTVLDPFMGSGTVGQVAQDLGRKWLGCELSPEYGKLVGKRTAQQGMVYA
jgi:site-specific DNA-methyltransferase (cytosine-N4-specific)